MKKLITTQINSMSNYMSISISKFYFFSKHLYFWCVNTKYVDDCNYMIFLRFIYFPTKHYNFQIFDGRQGKCM